MQQANHKLKQVYPEIKSARHKNVELYALSCLDILKNMQAGLHQDAAKLAVGLESQQQSLSLQIAIKYEQNDLAGQW